MKTYSITVPLTLSGEFEDDDSLEYIKEVLGLQLDNLLESTDYLSDCWKDAVLEEVNG